MVSVSVVVSTLNRRKLLEKCIKSLLCQDFDARDFEVVVVDGGSSDGTRQYLSRLSSRIETPRIIPVFPQGRVNLPASRNLAAMNSSGNVIASIDDDCVASVNWLSEVYRVHRDNEDALTVGAKLLNGTQRDFFARFVYKFQVYAINSGFVPAAGFEVILSRFRQPDEVGEVFCCGTGHNSFKKRIFDDGLYFAEEMVSSEDIEFSLRLHSKYPDGLFLFTPNASITHTYERGLTSLVRKFFRYGRGGPVFRKSLVKHGFSADGGIAYNLKFMGAIAHACSQRTVEVPAFLVLAFVAEASLYFGEFYERLRD